MSKTAKEELKQQLREIASELHEISDEMEKLTKRGSRHAEKELEK